ncbi:unnamed protein product [Linum tenue]|uniref:Uncharacterized protein n=1 Tax=Linum tenue TaxID=586396 RepID=A0AAV0MSC4_9ROSI|nr:unnamed protein product [Linum tenue]
MISRRRIGFVAAPDIPASVCRFRRADCVIHRPVLRGGSVLHNRYRISLPPATLFPCPGGQLICI